MSRAARLNLVGKKNSDILVLAVQRPKQQQAERTECLQIEQLLLQILHSLCT